MKSIAFYFFALLVLPLLFSCKNEVKESDSKEPVETAVEISEEKVVEVKKQRALSSSVISRAMMTPELSMFVSSVLSAGLIDALISGEKSYTIFAPSNEAFDAMDSKAKAKVYNLTNVADLKQLLQGHIVLGSLDSVALVNSIRNNNGAYKIITMSGAPLIASRDGLDIVFTDANGKKAKLVKSDIKAENGVLHVIDAVMRGE